MFLSKKNVVFQLSVLLMLLLLLPACEKLKYYNWAKYESNQGKKLPDYRKVVYNNLRDLDIYNEFSTLLRVNVLRVNEQVRRAYVEMRAKKRGIDQPAKEALLRKELEENNNWNSFYILADVRGKDHKSLTDSDSLWSVYLKLETGEDILPISIKEIDLEPEYETMFSYRFNRFKRSYEVKFPKTDLSGKLYVVDNAKLVFSSTLKKDFVHWGPNNNPYRYGKGKFKDEDFYWI